MRNTERRLKLATAQGPESGNQQVNIKINYTCLYTHCLLGNSILAAHYKRGNPHLNVTMSFFEIVQSVSEKGAPAKDIQLYRN